MKRYLWVASFLAASASAKVVNGQLIKVTRDTPVFAEASAKSKALADVERGTTLMIRKISPKGSWIFVEDEDRNRGWVPKNRTDYYEAPEEPEKEKPKIKQNVEAEEPEKKPVPNDEPSTYHHSFGFLGRRSFHDANGKLGLGGYYWLFLPTVISQRQGQARLHTLGLQTGFLRTSQNGSERGGYSVPLRLRMLAWDTDSQICSGPDFSTMFMRRPDGRDKNLWTYALGYSVGWMPTGRGFLPLIRGAVDFKHSTRLSLEVSIGYFL